MRWEDIKEDEEIEELIYKLIYFYAPLIASIMLVIGGLGLVIIWYLGVT